MSIVNQIGSERALLGACLSTENPHAYVDVAALVSSGDWWNPAHEVVWGALTALHDAGTPADPILVLAELERRGTSRAAGGAVYLTELYQAACTAVAVEFHGRAVADAATVRRVETAGARIAQRAADPGVDPAELVQWAGEQVSAAADERAGVQVLTRTWDDWLHRIPEQRTMVIPGLLGEGDRIVLTGSGGLGKALAADTPINTPKGWTDMGDLVVGDEVFGPDGVATQVIATSGLIFDRPCYGVTFSDGAQIVADAEHLWLTDTVKSRSSARAHAKRVGQPLKLRGSDQSAKMIHAQVQTTREISQSVWARADGTEANHSIPACSPLQFAAAELPIPPYVLGAWLGDGTSASAGFTCADLEITEHIQAEGIPCRQLDGYRWILSDGVRRGRYQGNVTVHAKLRELGVLGNKHIPPSYMRASVGQRLALLQGLMDTDGTVSVQARGATVCEFSVMSERLASDALELLLGLGIKVSMRASEAKLNGRTVGVRYRLPFQTELPVFRLTRKAEKLTPLRTPRAIRRHIIACDPVASVPVQCIQVDREDGLFVAGRQCITTHNSTMLQQIAVCAAAGLPPFDWQTQDPFDPVRVTIMDCENPDHRLKSRLWPMVKALRDDYGLDPRPNLTLGGEGNALDLLNPQTALSLLRTIEHDKPDLLYIGPVYKLHNDDPDKEAVVKRVTGVLDRIRALGVSVITEAHHTKAGGKAMSSLEPSGSNLWTWWPEFGLGLRLISDSDEIVRRCTLERWRIDREASAWPSDVESTGVPGLPWTRAAALPSEYAEGRTAGYVSRF